MKTLLIIVAALIVVSILWLTVEEGDTTIPSGGDDEAGGADPQQGAAPMSDGLGLNLPGNVQNFINQYSAQYGVNPNLATAQAYAESRGNQDAVSGAGAVGVFQLMPNTAKGLGVDPSDLEQNIKGGIQYLSQMLKRYDGNQTLALAAYNAGPGAVDKYGGVPPYPETQSYISNVEGLMQ